MQRNRFRFRDFELDVAAYEVRRKGHRVKLAKQPMDLLILLVENGGRLVSRDHIVQRLWSKDVFVDVETSINTAVRKIRQALRDTPGAPAFVETVPGKGYRFVAPIEVVSDVEQHNLPAIARESQAAQASQSQTSRVTLTVLPFAYLGSDPDRGYIADGLTDEIASSLAQIDPERLRVKGRMMRYKGTRMTAAEIGRELSVDYLVEGSIRDEGSRLRLIVRLLRVRDQEHVWSHSYDPETSGLLGLQKELSSTIAQQVRLKLSQHNLEGIDRRQTQNAAAYDAYLQARYFQRQRTPEANAHARREFERAIAIDPNYALAWSSLAFTYASSAINSDARPQDIGPRARDAAVQGVRTNPDLAETQYVIGYVQWLLDWDWKAAETSFRRAILLDPSSAAAQRVLGHALSQSGRKEESEAAMLRARELDPLDALNFALSAQVASQNRDFPAALAHARQSILLDSTLWIGYMQLGQAYEQMGQNELALEALADAARLSGGNSKSLSLRGYILAKIGRIADAQQVLNMLQTRSQEGYVPPYAMALVHAGFGEDESVFEWLDLAYSARDVHLIFLPVDPKWDPYRRDSRFHSILARCRIQQG